VFIAHPSIINFKNMANSQIGWSVEAKLLNEISKKLDRLISVTAQLTTTTTTTTVAP
jgi:hypothetical protein